MHTSSRRFATASVLLVGSLVGCSAEVGEAGSTGATGGSNSNGPSTGGDPSTGGASDQASTSVPTTGGSSGQGDPVVVSGCPGSVCCVPLVFSGANVNVYKIGDQASVNLLVERVLTVNPDYAWRASATVKTSFGSTQDCVTEGIYPSSSRYEAVQCPAVQSDVACGSNVTVEIKLQASGYTSEPDYTLACDGGLGMTLTYTVPVECPTCPSSPISENFKPCDMPGDTACWYPSLSWDGTFVNAPCYCTLDATGERKWQCAIA